MSMKSLKEYLTESHKTYGFRIKVAGKFSEDFAENAKSALGKFGCGDMKKVSSIPIQNKHIDFPQLDNIEVTVFEAECSYPTTPIEVAAAIRDTVKIPESNFNVRTLNDTTEIYFPVDAPKSGKALLDDPDYKEYPKIKSKDYFGDDFNKSFLRDLDKSAKTRKKELGQNVEYKLPKHKEDKAGTASAVGSSK